MFMGARHALLHVTKCSIQKNRLRERKKVQITKWKFTKNMQNLMFKNLITNLKLFIYLRPCLFHSWNTIMPPILFAWYYWMKAGRAEHVTETGLWVQPKTVNILRASELHTQQAYLFYMSSHYYIPAVHIQIHTYIFYSIWPL